MAANIASEGTAAAENAIGALRRDPFAMLPFCGYNMADYFAHWLKLGAAAASDPAKLPRLYMVNWFRKGPDGKFVWPGFGENMRVLAWMLGRIDGTAKGEENAFGITPRYEDLNWNGLSFTQAQFDDVTSMDPAAWREELKLHAELFETLKHRLPQALLDTKADIERRLNA
jgi:phosphoenolpyruvate carboxykinase (GTP)